MKNLTWYVKKIKKTKLNASVKREEMLITSTHLTMEVFSIYHPSSAGIKNLLCYNGF